MTRRRNMRIPNSFRVGAVCLGLAACWPAAGQIFESTVTARSLQLPDQVKKEREEARFKLGVLRLMPYVTVKDIGYNNNVFGAETEGKVSDYTATVAPGTRLLGPFGRKFDVRGGVEPAYYWWKDLTYLRGWGLTGDGQVLALLNHVTIGGGGRYADTIQLVNSESNVRSRQKQSTGEAAIEWDFLKRLSVFGRYETVQTRLDDSTYADPGQAQSYLLNRTEDGARAGLRYRFDSRFSIGAMGQWSRARFVNEAAGRDNDGLGALATARYDRERFYVELTGGYQEAKGKVDTTTFPEYRTGTYSYFVSYFIEKKVELQVTGWRRPQYSYFEGNPYYFETRNGVALLVGLGHGHRVAVGGTFSLGTNAYPVAVTSGSTTVTRKDDVMTVGGILGWVLSPSTTLTLNIKNDKYTSNLPGQGRSVATISGGVNWNFGMFRVGAGAQTR